MPSAIWLGLTGGIGSGKSTVAQMLADRGAAVIDADAISRAVTACGGPAIGPIAKTFGPDFITTTGALDRDRMRELVYAHSDTKQRLEAIIHPLVGQESDRQAAAAIQQGRFCLVFDVPLLVEAGDRWRKKLNRILVIDCDPSTQIERVMARNELAREVVERIIANQATRLQRLASADLVIHNQELSLSGLRAEVTQIARRFGL